MSTLDNENSSDRAVTAVFLWVGITFNDERLTMFVGISGFPLKSYFVISTAVRRRELSSLHSVGMVIR